MLLRMWLHGRSANTALAYEGDARRFLAFTGEPLTATTLAQLQAYADSLDDVAPATRARRLASVKSLLNFAAETKVMPLNPGAALRVSKPEAIGAERILSEAEIAKLLGAEIDPRRHALLRLLYVCGLRASEVCSLRWQDLTGSERKGGEARVLGKGGKLRRVTIPAGLWRELVALTPAIRPEAPVIHRQRRRQAQSARGASGVQAGDQAQRRERRGLAALGPPQPRESRATERRGSRPRPRRPRPRLDRDHVEVPARQAW